MKRCAYGTRNPADVDAPEVVGRIREIDASLEQFAPLYLNLLSIQSETYALPRHVRGEHLRASMSEALAAMLIALARRRAACTAAGGLALVG